MNENNNNMALSMENKYFCVRSIEKIAKNQFAFILRGMRVKAGEREIDPHKGKGQRGQSPESTSNTILTTATLKKYIFSKKKMLEK